jgi:hypothetical protein
MELVVGLKEARREIALLAKRRVIERSFASARRSRRVARDHERPPEVLRGMHFLAFAILMLVQIGCNLKKCLTGSSDVGIRLDVTVNYQSGVELLYQITVRLAAWEGAKHSYWRLCLCYLEL